MSTEDGWAYTFVALPVLGILTLLSGCFLHATDSPAPVKVTPITGYDCSGDSPVDPCVIPSATG